MADARARQVMNEVQIVYGVAHEAFALGAHAESVALLEAHGPEHARGVFHEAQGVQGADALVADVFLTVEEVHELTEHLRIEAHRHGVDGKVAAIEVHLDGAAFHLRQGSGFGIEFEARGGDVHLDFRGVGKVRAAMPLHVGAEAFGGKHEHGGHEFAVLAHAALEPYGQIVRKGHGVSPR